MEWLVIAGLVVWVWLQSRRIGTLTRRVTALEARAPAAAAVAEAPAAPIAAQEDPLLLDTPLANDVEAPLLLDTPLPEASNDEDDTPKPLPPLAEPVRAEAPAAPRVPDRRFEQWLAENGLAWLGGGAFALGAIFLVSFAAQQAWFTPAVQLACAVALGLALIGAGEWARRASAVHPPGHPLVAALLAGAGVVALYAAAWASHGLYNFADADTMLVLLTICAGVLIGLSFRHGEALGVLAVIAALLAPALGSSVPWPTPLLTLFVCVLGASGFALAALRRWPWVGLVTLLGLYFWFAAAIAADETRRALAMLSMASLGAALIALRPPLKDDAPRHFSWAHARAFGPSVAIAVSSVLLLWVWLSAVPTLSGRVAGPALIACFQVALASYAVRARLAHEWTLAVSIGALVLGFVSYLNSRLHFGPQGVDFYPTILVASAVVVLCSVTARPQREGRALISGVGALGSAVLTALAASSRPDWHSPQAWVPLLLGAILLFAAAWHAERRARDRGGDVAIDLWAGAGALLVFIAIESAVPATARAAAHAGAAMLLAAAHSWRGWRVLRPLALTAAAITIAHALSPDLIGASLAATIPIWGGLLILGVAAALLFAAGAFVRDETGRSPWSEALGSAGVVVILIGSFLLLRWIAAGGAGSAMDTLSEAALRALALCAAGHVLLPRPGQVLGVIGRWRGHLLLGAGLLYALLVPGLEINPWWGGAIAASVVGPPVLDTLLLAFAAPALIAFLASRRLYDRERRLARAYAAAGVVLTVMWLVLCVRRAFHGEAMATAGVGLFEGACYGLIYLATALAVAAVARWRAAKQADGPLALDLSRVMRIAAWIGIVLGGVTLLLARHPIWGVHAALENTALDTGLATLTQLVGVGLALLLGRMLSISRELIPARFAAATLAALLAWSFGHAAIRWLAQGAAMDEALPMAGLEGFAHALWPLVFVVGAGAATARAPGRDTVRAYLHDLQALWASAIWPALLYAAFGLWLFFNPWWGAEAPRIDSLIDIQLTTLAFAVAAALSAIAARTPFARWPTWLTRVAVIACLGHLIMAATMLVRWLYHGAEMGLAPAVGAELWSYSALWAVFGAGVFGLGLVRSDALLRWSGLAILLATTAFVFYLTLTQLTGVAQFGSMLGLAVVLMGVAWAARSYRLTPPAPTDLLIIKSNGRRGRRREWR